ncbi:PD-(D/E)XK nuclease-like domain-containing protein [Bradyrhizobium sp. C-145]|uniref:PD-(D/E)XK nuclease-like domain-containing protein n=1 Tax=Bradyrhizobium sp. C-145 TaxID=574727 RepID=UPI00201B47FE|nr:PD-(D/E)XK nuclease-like domain-containing protein [Bradyrhizobium sp. C-145]UQR66187.1 PD-(D/E)XK nuclease-like domain-containing protein [Bradyrhizobium sp. C-145]
MQSILWDGKPITRPGLYRNIPLADYHRHDLCDSISVSSSMFRNIIRKSPAHAFANSSLNPHRDRETQTESMALGRFVHKAVAGEPFDDDCMLCPPLVKGEPFNMRKKVWQDWKADQEAAGKYVITPSLATRAKGMIIALGQFPLVQQGMLGGSPERSLVWKDPRGFWKKARPDEMPNDSGDFVDLKTTASVLYRDTQYSIAEYGYMQQAAMVMEGARALGMVANSFTLLWVESEKPHCVRAQTLKDEDLARGHHLNELAGKTFWQCYQSGEWPGPGDDRPDAEYVDMPDWWRKSVDDRVKYELREAA